MTNLVAQSKSLLTGVDDQPDAGRRSPRPGRWRPPSRSSRPGCRSPTTWQVASAGRSPTWWRPPCSRTPTAPRTRWARGPFVFKEWIPNDHFTATANPNYWRKGMPYLSQITFKPIPDEQSRAEALKSGTIDLMITDTPQIITEFRGNHAYAYIDDSSHVAGEPDMNCIQLNCLAKPFNDPNVRRAAAMAINRKQYAKVIDENVLPVSNGLFIPGSPYYSTTQYPAYNPSQATRLVKAARPRRTAGRSRSRTARPTRRPPSVPPQYLEQAWGAVGFKVTTSIVAAGRDDQQRLGGQVPSAGLAPVRCGRPRPQLHLLEHDHGELGLALHQHGPQRRPHDREGAARRSREHRQGRPEGRLPDGEQAAGPGPPLFVDRTGRSGRSSGLPTSRTSTTPLRRRVPLHSA